jgi:hypothetical protein
VACAASKHARARRRYSAPRLLVTTKTPDRRYKRGARPSLERPVKRAAGKWPREEPPGGARLRGYCNRASHPRATLQLASVKSVPARGLLLDSGKPVQRLSHSLRYPLATTPPGLAGGLARVSAGHPAQDQPPQS